MDKNQLNTIILFGVVPLYPERKKISPAPAGRTWQFASSMLEEGFRVVVVAQDEEDDVGSVLSGDKMGVRSSKPVDNLKILRLPEKDFRNTAMIKNALSDVDFRFVKAIVSAGSLLPALMAARMRKEVSPIRLIPLWLDLYGDPICEIQAKITGAPAQEKYDELFHVWQLLTESLLVADKVSVVSMPQFYEVIGQLSLLGRLNPKTGNYSFADVIPCAIDLAALSDEVGAFGELIKKRDALKIKHGFPRDSFVVYWSGSFNAWMDVETLFNGIDAAMKDYDKICFLSSGGGITRYFEDNYKRFCALVEKSDNRARYVLKGWIGEDELRECYAVADLGINCDKETYEGIFGSRNRILSFLSFAVPVISTTLTDLTWELAGKDLIFTFEMSNPMSLRNRLLYLAKTPEELVERAKKAAQYVMRQFNYKDSTLPLIKWLSEPKTAPDNSVAALDGGVNAPANPIAEYMNYHKMKEKAGKTQTQADAASEHKDKINKNLLDKIRKLFS